MISRPVVAYTKKNGSTLRLVGRDQNIMTILTRWMHLMMVEE
nr:MAG TPA: hypothetical protein [Caudoviricetes sp.]